VIALTFLEETRLEGYTLAVVHPRAFGAGWVEKPTPVFLEKASKMLGSEGREVMVQDISAAAREVLEPMGYEVLEVVISGKVTMNVLVRIDRLDEQPVSVEDLERASGVFGLEMDRLDPFKGAYKLEVESPGPKRPLTRARHFERMMGLKIKVKRPGASVIGKILAVTDDAVTLELDGKKVEQIPIAGIVANLAEWPSEHR
jgi:ribosome maturation factor RimP